MTPARQDQMVVWNTHFYLIAGICLGWLVSEIILSRLLFSSAESSSTLDRSSFRVLWITIAVSMTIGCMLSGRGIGQFPRWTMSISVAGLVLVVAGLIVRWTAILTLRRHFTTNVSIREDHELVSDGLYGVVRHPSYTGSLLSFFGVGLTFASWLGTLSIFIPILLAFLYRINVEEAALRNHFGARYEDYAKHVKRLIPLIY